ncbi:MAG: branched-chain amino acid ABC transporter permease [Burkholderiaceae bacterium]
MNANQSITERPRFLGATPRQTIVNVLLLAAMLLLPLAAHAGDQPFWLDFATRIVILAIAAVTLNFILGFGGLVSFGHAAFVGIGAYAVGIPAYYDIGNGFVHLAVAMLAGALFALVTGAVSLRTRGIHFIMITMAFAQMVYFGVVSIEEYGGDDGLVIYSRSELPFIDLGENLNLFLFCYGTLLIVLYLVHRFVNSRFGMVLQGGKDNEQRMSAVGFDVYGYRLVAYVISGALCALAGALLGNFTSFISPEMMDWTRSGELIFMVILGGTATIFGPVLGAALFLLLEELLSGASGILCLVLECGDHTAGLQAWLDEWSVYWHLPFGLILILTVLFAKGGLIRLLYGPEKRP